MGRCRIAVLLEILLVLYLSEGQYRFMDASQEIVTDPVISRVPGGVRVKDWGIFRLPQGCMDRDP